MNDHDENPAWQQADQLAGRVEIRDALEHILTEKIGMPTKEFGHLTIAQLGDIEEELERQLERVRAVLAAVGAPVDPED